MSSPVGWTTRVSGASRVATPPSTSAPARAAVAPARPRRVSTPFGCRPRRRRAPARAASDEISHESSLPDLTRPGLTPWDVLGVAASEDPGFEPTAGEARAAFRRQILLYHPDVYRGDILDAAAQTKTLVKALKAVLDEDAEIVDAYGANVARSTKAASSDATDDASSDDFFAFPETVADCAFVNPFTCTGVKNCPSYCNCTVTAPFAFEARDTVAGAGEYGQTVARFKPGAPRYSELEAASSENLANNGFANEDAASMAYRLNCAVQQCPPGAIQWVTPKQSAFLQRVVDEFVGELENGRLTDAEETSAYIAALLAKADFENGRFAAPARRAPKRSGKWVDWY